MTALYFFGTQITWTGIIIALACVTALVAGTILRSYQNRGSYEFFLCSAICCLFGVFFSRFMYWYCNPEAYSGFSEVFTASQAGQSVGGMLLGVAVAVCLMGVFFGKQDMLRLFDCICTAGSLGLAIGRLAGFTNTSDRGRMIFESAILQRFPFAVEVAVEGSTESEWRFATFVFEAAADMLIFIICSRFFIKAYSRGAASQCDGLTALLFCALFGSTQAILESTRYDSLFFHFNGFVSIVQIISAVLLVGSLVAGFVLSRRQLGKSASGTVRLVCALVLVCCAGGLEYLVQRYTDKYPLWYGLMILVIGAACALSVGTLNRLLDARLSAKEG